MDEFKPEDELRPDPSDRRAGRSRQSSDRDNEPQINFDDVDVEADERRPAHKRKYREAQEEAEYAESADETGDRSAERRPRKRKTSPVVKPASRQYLMMGLGILVLLLLIIGIGSALKAPSSPSEPAANGGERNINLSGSGDAAADQANGAQPAPGSAPVNQTQDTGAQNPDNSPQDLSVPPISSTPTQGQSNVPPQGQQRVEVQGDLNSALTQPQGQIDSAATNSTLPTAPATVAPVRGATSAPRQPANRDTVITAPSYPERKHPVSEPKPQNRPQATVRTEPKPVTSPKHSEPAKRVEQPKHTATASVNTTSTAATGHAPAKAATPAVEAAKPATTSTAKATATPPAAATSGGAKEAGNVGALKSAPASHYTLQLSSSSNYDNLNNWAKKESVKNYVVYQTTRNGQPWYVLVSGIYATKDDAKRAVSSLPADVQAKNPWAKPVRQVQSDLK